jgi:hypothetical protein
MHSDRPLYPPEYYATQIPVLNPEDTADLASDVESVPESSLHSDDFEMLDREAAEVEAQPVEPVRGRDDLLAPAILPESDRGKSDVKWPVKGPKTHRGMMVC